MKLFEIPTQIKEIFLKDRQNFRGLFKLANQMILTKQELQYRMKKLDRIDN